MPPRRPTPCGNALEARVGGVFIEVSRSTLDAGVSVVSCCERATKGVK